jgi:OmpA-OmpF porin, OOP family
MRRFSAFIVATMLAGTATGAAFAQTAGAEAKVDVNCALYAECAVDDGAQAAVEAAPVAKPGVRTGKTRGFSMTGPPPSAAPVAGAPRVGRPVVATTTGVRRPVKVVSPAARPKLIMAMQTAAAVKAGQLITFATGSAELTPDAKQLAQQLAAAMQRPDKLTQRFSVQGHTDAVGSRALNLALSQRRASALAAYLVSQGVAPTRLDTVGYGFDQPLTGKAVNSPENRRVEVKATK